MSPDFLKKNVRKFFALNRTIKVQNSKNYFSKFQDSEYCSEALEEFDYWLSRVERKLATTLKKPATKSEASQILASTKVISVVYFDQQTGAPRAVRWSKSIF